MARQGVVMGVQGLGKPSLTIDTDDQYRDPPTSGASNTTENGTSTTTWDS